MKQVMVLLTIMFLISACAQPGPTGPQGPSGNPGTDTQGNINSNTTWTAAGSPYILEKNILVKNGVTLTLQPGTIVSMNPGIAIYVDGTLKAQGTTGNHILFKKEGTIGGGSLYFTTTSTGSILRYCELQDQGISFCTGTPDVQFCKITTGASAIWRDASSGSVAINISNCSFIGNSSANNCIGINGALSGSLTNCIVENFYFGLEFTGNFTLANCSIINNSGYGIYASDSCQISVTNSNLYGGTYYYYNSTANNQTATNNWWGTTNTAAIDSKIYDKNDNPSFGTVNYSGYLSSAATVTGCGW